MLGDKRSIFSTNLFFYISVGLLLLPIVGSQIPLGSRLSVEERNHWVSPNGDFAIGFFNQSNQYSIGIHFASPSIPIDKKTVVWVAGADLRVGEKSYFQLTQDGELVLFDSTRGAIAWASKTGNSSVSSAELLDSGNLLLTDNNKNTVWQSFDTPSNTLLPGQNFSAFKTLRAASMNSLSSYYSLHMDGSGQLQLKWESNVVYWSSGTSPSQSPARAILGSDGTFRLLDQNSSSLWSVSGEDHSDSDVKFRILRLDEDGNLRLLSWTELSNSWQTAWQAVENQCDVFATCGVSGICAFNTSGSPVCLCPFSPMKVSGSKCLIPYGQNCHSGYSMVVYNHTFLYAVYPPNETVTQTNLEQCKSVCLEDKSCTAATFVDDGSVQCRIKRTPYVSGRSGATVGSVSFVKQCSDPVAVLPILPKSTPPSSSDTGQPRASRKIDVRCVIGVAAGTFVAFAGIQLGIGMWLYRRRRSGLREVCSAYHGECTFPSGLFVLSYSEVKDLTENFKHQLGQNMFKGVLPGNKHPVVVKDLNVNVGARKFRRGVSMIGSIHHKNLVKLEGYCCELSHRFIVYEFVTNGSLGNCFENPMICERLTWRKRMEICLTLARAIAYLHNGCREFITHGSLTCENVVLDDNLEVKVSEFGLRSICEGEVEAQGNSGPAEQDARDFGSIMVALIRGNPKTNCDDIEWAYEKWMGGQAEEIVDKTIGEVNLDELERVLRLAFWCFQVDDRMRPSMGEIVNVLEGALTVDFPPPPFAPRNPLGEEEDDDSEV